MTDRKIRAMLKEIVKEVDYDIYCQIFETPEEPELAKEQIQNLIAIVKEHIK